MSQGRTQDHSSRGRLGAPPSAVSQVMFKATEAFKKPEAGMCLNGMLYDQWE